MYHFVAWPRRIPGVVLEFGFPDRRRAWEHTTADAVPAQTVVLANEATRFCQSPPAAVRSMRGKRSAKASPPRGHSRGNHRQTGRTASAVAAPAWRASSASAASDRGQAGRPTPA